MSDSAGVDPFRDGARFLTQQQQQELNSALHDIRDWTGSVRPIIRREVSSGLRVSTCRPKRRGSEPPINVGALDLLDHLHVVLASWADSLADSVGGPPVPADAVTPEALAVHLGFHTDRIAACYWAPDCVSEVQELARKLLKLVFPPEESISDRYSPADVGRVQHLAVGSADDMAFLLEVIDSQRVSAKTIRSWARRGHIEELTGPGGQPWFRYSEVRAEATRDRRRHAGRK